MEASHALVLRAQPLSCGLGASMSTLWPATANKNHSLSNLSHLHEPPTVLFSLLGVVHYQRDFCAGVLFLYFPPLTFKHPESTSAVLGAFVEKKEKRIFSFSFDTK